MNAFNPGPTATRLYAAGWPGIDQATLPKPEEVAKAIVPLCLPECTESGRVYDYPSGKFLSFNFPS